MNSVQQTSYISSALFILFVISLWLAVCTVTRNINRAEPVLHYRAFSRFVEIKLAFVLYKIGFAIIYLKKSTIKENV